MTEKQYHTGALELMPLTEKLVADARTYESTASYDAGNRITNWNRAGAPVNNAQSWNYDDNGNWISTTKTALIWWGNSEKHRRLVGVLDRMSGASEARRVKAREASLNQCAEHKHQAGQTVIQNDIMAHPSRLNSVIARAVDGSKFKLEWYHKNYLDHVYAVSDDSGDILEHYRYTAFGEVTIYNDLGNQVTTTQIDNHILWNTRRRDEVTGYYLYKFRHYSAELGRWPSRDPMGENWSTGEFNKYAFVGNDSINWFDYLGLQHYSPTPVEPNETPRERAKRCVKQKKLAAQIKTKVSSDLEYCTITIFGGHSFSAQFWKSSAGVRALSNVAKLTANSNSKNKLNIPAHTARQKK